MKIVVIFLITTVVFTVIDLIWLGIVAQPLYNHFLGHLKRPSPYWPAAIAFYLLFIVGMMIFAVVPAIAKQSVLHALMMGAAYGFFTYMTFDLTNWAVLKDWPAGVVFIDIAWGTLLSLSVSSISTWIYLKCFGA